MKRSLWIFGLAMGVTLVTYFFIREGFIVFGVLHLIGVSLLLAYPFLRLHGANFIFGLLFILCWIISTEPQRRLSLAALAGTGAHGTFAQ